jgi:hypothetical protein
VRSEVRIFPDPPHHGAIAQLGERLICIQEVGGSIPPGSTIVDVKAANRISVGVLQRISAKCEIRNIGLFFKNL